MVLTILAVAPDDVLIWLMAEDIMLMLSTPLSALPRACSATPFASLAFMAFCLVMDDISAGCWTLLPENWPARWLPETGTVRPCLPERSQRPPVPLRCYLLQSLVQIFHRQIKRFFDPGMVAPIITMETGCHILAGYTGQNIRSLVDRPTTASKVLLTP